MILDVNGKPFKTEPQSDIDLAMEKCRRTLEAQLFASSPIILDEHGNTAWSEPAPNPLEVLLAINDAMLNG
jgi:hypothetical protein